MSVYRRGDSWYINIMLSGTRINRKAGRSKKEAQIVVAELKTMHRLKKLNVQDITDEAPPFSYAADLYLKYCMETRKARTYELADTDYKKHLSPFFCKYQIDGINTDVLKQYQSAKKKQGYANRTINIHIGLVRKVLNHDADERKLPHPTIKYPMLPESQKEHAFLTPEERDAFIASFPINTLSAKRALFALMTGLRPSELSYLSWNDISLEMKSLKVTSKPPAHTVKTNQERTVPLNQVAVDILQGLLKLKPGRWVFGVEGHVVKNIRKSIDNAAKKAGITKKITPNMLRHTFATLAIMKGADLKSVQTLMGHSDISTTQKYLHAVESQLRKTVDLLEN